MNAPLHLAIIMDGNGRWARARGRRREHGHREGAKAVRRVVEAAPDAGVGILTLYAFSSDNWQRPPREVSALMSLFRRYLRSEVPELRANGVRLQVIGRRDRLPATVVRAVEEAEAATGGGERMLLRLAVDYSARHALLDAARRCLGHAGPGYNGNGNGTAPHELDRDDFSRALGDAIHGKEVGAPDVDLLIRTGGEKRLSDFLLWECAYAELVFMPRMWPDFNVQDLNDAMEDFGKRERRFGLVAEAV